MFERTRDYPTALTASSAGHREAVREAARWFLTQHEQIGGEPLLYVPGRANVGYDPVIQALSQRVKTETWKTLRGSGWRGGAVLAAWPTAKQLGVIADDWRTKALCVVSWNEDDVRPWAAAAHPDLLSPGAEPAAVPQLDPVVEEGMKTMTLLVNHNNHLAGSFDRHVAVAILLTLHDARHPSRQNSCTRGRLQTNGRHEVLSA